MSQHGYGRILLIPILRLVLIRLLTLVIALMLIESAGGFIIIVMIHNLHTDIRIRIKKNIRNDDQLFKSVKKY